ncbi:hypothetical protein [Undibacterium sp. TJN19]
MIELLHAQLGRAGVSYVNGKRKWKYAMKQALAGMEMKNYGLNQ